jgi:hypothetical protein
MAACLDQWRDAIVHCDDAELPARVMGRTCPSLDVGRALRTIIADCVLV